VRRFAKASLLVSLGALVGFLMGWLMGGHESDADIQRVVAISWGDGRYGEAFYGAHVYLEPRDDGYAVQARVYVGRSTGWLTYSHDIGELGRVASAQEAVARWGEVQWSAEGLRLGKGEGSYFLPRAEFENHR
jgi:hypothetical protein